MTQPARLTAGMFTSRTEEWETPVVSRKEAE